MLLVYLTQKLIFGRILKFQPDERPMAKLKKETYRKKGTNFLRIWVKEPRHSQKKISRKCKLYRSTRPSRITKK